MVQFKEFRIGDLFEIGTGLLIGKSTLVEGSVPRISAKTGNNGILGYFDTEGIDGARHFENFISVNFFGTAYYHPYKASLEMKVHSLKLKDVEFTEGVGLYLVTVLNKLFSAYGFSYGEQLSSTDLKMQALYIELPVTSSGEPDFAYMEQRIAELEAERIAELEAERIAELEAYLVAAGLDDYELSEDDKELLSLSPFAASDETGRAADAARLRKIEVGEFRVGDLFEKLQVKKANKKELSKVRTDEYCVPAVYAKAGDNGIMYWGKRGAFATYANVISIVYNGAIAAGLVYAQPDETGILAESYLIRLKDTEVSFETNLYLKTVIEKVIYPRYSRDNLATWAGKVENDFIQLPVTSSGEPDFEYMARYIKAQQKLAIADAVKLKDEIVKTTKQVVNG